jgi:hypothetical protein
MPRERSRGSRPLCSTCVGVLVFLCASMPYDSERRDTRRSWGVAVAGGYGQPPVLASEGAPGATANTIRLTHSIAVSLASAAIVCLPFDTEVTDVPGWHSTVSNPTRVTVGNAGMYLITGTIQYQAGGAGNRYAILSQNGVTQVAANGGMFSASANVALVTVTTMTYLLAGDYIELCGFQETGSASNSEAQIQRGPILALNRIGP